jgi:negative regulator of replication initiation
MLMTDERPEFNVTVSHTVPVEIAQWIAIQARTLGISKSEVIRRALAAAKAGTTAAEVAA